MDTATFLKKVLPKEGLICIADIDTTGRVAQRFFPDIEKSLGRVEEISGKKNVFVALSTFKSADSRKQENVENIQSLFLDLDAGKHHKKPQYENKKEALLALRAFVKKTKIASPILVDSGNGIHVYWRLTRPMGSAEWVNLATAFVKYCLDNGLNVDIGVSKDSARIMRVPNTINLKSNKAAKVLHDSEALLDPDELANELDVEEEDDSRSVLEEASKTSKFSSPVMDRLSSNHKFRFKKILKKTAEGRGCAQLAHIVAKQHEIEEPLWRAGLSIVKFCVDSQKAAYQISHKYPEYSAQETKRKMDGIEGPYLCRTFDEYRPNVCKNCKHQGKIKSPISLGRDIQLDEREEISFVDEEGEKVDITAVKEVSPISYPTGYARGKHGGVYKIGGEDEDTELIYSNDIYVIRRIVDPIIGETVIMRLHLPHDKPREFMLPLSHVSANEKFKDEMAKNGVALMDYNKLRKYTTAWVNELQAKGQADNAARQFGWVDDNFDQFVVGDRIIKRDTIEPNYPTRPTAKLINLFTSAGTYEEWKKAISYYNKPGMEIYQYVVVRSFASVLVKMIPFVHASGLHMHSADTGYGKTTSLWAAMSAWGNPEQLVPKAKDTQNFIYLRGELFNNIHLPIDELTNLKGSHPSELIMNMSTGEQPGRLTRSANEERQRGVPWNLLWTSTGNASAEDLVSRDKAEGMAEGARVFDVRMDLIPNISTHESYEFLDKLTKNYGHAGWRFVQYVIQNKEMIKNTLEQTRARLDKLNNLTTQDRFWSTDIACTVTAGMICNRMQMLPFPVNNYVTVSKQLVNMNRRNTNDTRKSAMDVMVEFVYDNYGSFNIVWDSKERHEVLGQKSPDYEARVKLVGRFEQKTKKLDVSKSAFKQWCMGRKINFRSLEEELKKKHKALFTKRRLSTGSKINLPAIHCISVRADLDFSNVEN